MSEDKDQSVVSEFADAIREMGGPENMARFMAETRGWTQAFHAVCDAVDLIPTDNEHTVHRFAAETVARALFKAMQEKGIETMWPLRFGKP